MSNKSEEPIDTGGRLFVCATPIGNLRDITLRAIDTLGSVDLIAAEDTRVTRKLLSFHGISRPCLSYREENRQRAGQRIMNKLEAGARVALVSDAGTPGISDPGHDLIKKCIERGIPVEVIPGPSAAISALVASGLPAARFTCEGFLPRRKSQRRQEIERLKGEERTTIFFESPHRTGETLEDMRSILGERPMALVRELTKKFEEVIRGTPEEIMAQLQGRDLKGEIVLVVRGAGPSNDNEGLIEEAVQKAVELVEAGLSVRDAASLVSRVSGLSRKKVYNGLIEVIGH